MARIERDMFRDLDWTKVYAKPSSAVSDAAGIAYLRIRQHELRRQRKLRTLRRMAGAAACVALIVGAAVFILHEKGGSPDHVVPLASDVLVLRENDEVYASRADEYFHMRTDCPKVMGAHVALKLVTALEFEKELCPDCGANYRVER